MSTVVKIRRFIKQMRFRGMYPESFLVRLIISPKIHFKAGSWVSYDVQTFLIAPLPNKVDADDMLANCGGDKEVHQTK